LIEHKLTRVVAASVLALSLCAWHQPPAQAEQPCDDLDLLTHRVAPGENLGGIADELGVDQETLISLNSIPDPNALSSGQVICYPSKGTEATEPTRSDEVPAPSDDQTVEPSGDGQPTISGTVGLTSQAVSDPPASPGGANDSGPTASLSPILTIPPAAPGPTEQGGRSSPTGDWPWLAPALIATMLLVLVAVRLLLRPRRSRGSADRLGRLSAMGRGPAAVPMRPAPDDDYRHQDWYGETEGRDATRSEQVGVPTTLMVTASPLSSSKRARDDDAPRQVGDTRANPDHSEILVNACETPEPSEQRPVLPLIVDVDTPAPDSVASPGEQLRRRSPSSTSSPSASEAVRPQMAAAPLSAGVLPHVVIPTPLPDGRTHAKGTVTEPLAPSGMIQIEDESLLVWAMAEDRQTIIGIGQVVQVVGTLADRREGSA
jgi:hypothetical protein